MMAQILTLTISRDFLMNTKVKDWHIVSIYDKDQLVGRVLWGICTRDMTRRFSVGDYVCTSRIIEIIPKENLVRTFSGNTYLVDGDGQKSQIQVLDFELLRGGLSPDEISFLTEKQKMELVKLRFSDLKEDDLVDADTFFEDLDSGKYDF